MAYLRATPALRYLPVLTIPAVTDLSTMETRSSGLLSRLLRGDSRRCAAYNFNAVIARIEEHSNSRRPTPRRQRQRPKQRQEKGRHDRSAADEVESPSSLCRSVQGFSSAIPEARVALDDVGSAVALERETLVGQHLRLLNISSSGLLVESGVRLSPGSATTFKIGGPDLDLVVPARIVRCRVAVWTRWA